MPKSLFGARVGYCLTSVIKTTFRTGLGSHGVVGCNQQQQRRQQQQQQQHPVASLPGWLAGWPQPPQLLSSSSSLRWPGGLSVACMTWETWVGGIYTTCGVERRLVDGLPWGD